MILKIRNPAGCVFFFLLACPLFSARASSAAFLQQSQDSSSKSAAATQQPTPAPQAPATGAPKEVAPLKKAVREKKVITEDDFAKAEKPLLPSDVDEEENNPLCDLGCEAELRSQLAITPDHELEFRNQLTLARHQISYDRAWNSNLESGTRAAGQYCDLQRHKAEMAAGKPVAQSIRDDINVHYIEREREFAGQYRNYEGLIKQRIAEVEHFASLRAAIMQYEWDNLVRAACPDYKLP